MVSASGPKALYDLYMAGASFRLMPETPIDTSIIYIPGKPKDVSGALDSLGMDNIIVARSPGSIMGVDDGGRIVFYGLPCECPYERHEEAYMECIMALSLYGVPVEGARMPQRRDMIFGRPYPGIKGTYEAVPLPGLEGGRVPMPIARSEARALYGMDRRVMLPPEEYAYAMRPNPGEEESFIWRRIMPAAFAWYHYFSTTEEERWGVNHSHFTFKDCEDAIRREIHRLGISPDLEEAVMGGDLLSAYMGFVPAPLTLYVPRLKEPTPWQREWDSLSQAQKDALRVRQKLKARRRRRKAAEGRERKPTGKRPQYDLGTAVGIKELYAAGKISKPYYYRKLKELKAKEKATRQKGKLSPK